MTTFYVIIFFIFGLVFGSFYNVLGFRLPKNESIVHPHSHCMKCGHTLKAYEMVPVLSYIFLRGKCKNCKNKISIIYPIIELITGVLFALSYYSFGFSIDTFILIVISSLFSIIIVSDLNYYVIPDSVLVVAGILIFIANIIKRGILDACTYVLYGAILFALMYFLMLLGNALFKRESLGGGDIKLMGVLSMTMTPIMSFISLAIGSFIALPISIFFAIKNKDTVIPFGPFILIGFLITLFTKIDAHTVLQIFTF